MKTTSLKTALGGGALVLALIGGGAFLSALASAGEQHLYLGDGAPATLQQVRRIFVAPAYGYDDPYDYDGPAYYSPPVAAYGPPVAYGPPIAYAPPPAYDYVPPVDYDYAPPPGAGVAVVGPRGGVYVGY